jgi:hypothetical protein
MAFKQKSHGSSFKMMGASPVKQWQVPLVKEAVKQGVKWMGKNKIATVVGADAVIGAPGMWDSKKAWYHNVGDIAWDGTAGLAFDVLDVVGAATGGWKEKSINRPWDGKNRINEKKKVTTKWDKKTNDWIDTPVIHDDDRKNMMGN